MNTATEDRPKIHMDYLESKVDDPKVLEENPSANAKSGDRCSEAIQGVHLNWYESRFITLHCTVTLNWYETLLQWTTVDYIWACTYTTVECIWIDMRLGILMQYNSGLHLGTTLHFKCNTLTLTLHLNASELLWVSVNYFTTVDYIWACTTLHLHLHYIWMHLNWYETQFITVD